MNIITIIKRAATGTSLTQMREAECGLILNALEVLRSQRAIAIKTFGAHDAHLAELDDERAALLAQARDLGAAWA